LNVVFFGLAFSKNIPCSRFFVSIFVASTVGLFWLKAFILHICGLIIITYAIIRGGLQPLQDKLAELL
jgi:hypothetical protein